MMPGILRGKIILRKALKGPAPMSRAASSREKSIFESTLLMDRIIYGIKTWVSPITMPSWLGIRLRGEKPRSLRNWLIGPWRPRTIMSPRVRATTFVSKGVSTMMNIVDLRAPRLRFKIKARG